MKRLFPKYLVLLVALGSVSCSAFNKLLKSDDNDKKYTRAIEYYNEGKYDKCALLLESLNQVFAGTERADTLAYYYGAALYKDGDFVTRGKIFDAFPSDIYPESICRGCGVYVCEGAVLLVTFV